MACFSHLRHPHVPCPPPSPPSAADEKHFEDNLEELRLRWRIEVAPAAPQNTQKPRRESAAAGEGDAGAAPA